MSAIDPLDEQKAVRLRQRLWGAAVLIALLVIFLPLLLDGSGSESQYRRVERLRAEPPRVLDAEGIPETVDKVAEQLVESSPESASLMERLKAMDTRAPETPDVPPIAQVVPINEPAVVEPEPPVTPATTRSAEPLTAWVVQAGSFSDEANAVAVRNKLRRAGFPSFVTPANDSATPMYRVRVGPMINLQQAEASRNKVMRLLDREAIVVSYP